MEALGAVAAGVDILARSLTLLERARGAWERQKNGVSYLGGVCSDVKATIAVLKLVDAEKDWLKGQVNQAASLVQGKAQNLYIVIADLDRKSQIGGGFRKFMDHFIDGLGEKQRLEEMRKDLNDAKTTLIVALQMAQVGLIRSMPRGDVIVNVEIVNQIDQRVQLCPGLEKGLRLMQLLQQRGWTDEQGKWHLSDQDLTELRKPPPYEYKPAPLAKGQTRAVVQQNEIVGATFIGLNVGKDGGNEHSIYQPDELIVSNNKASGGAFFVGGGISASNLVYLMKNGVHLPTGAAQQESARF